MPTVALVIVNYRSAQDTIACIDAVRRTAGELVSQVVVVDNASGDDGVREIEEALPEAEVVRSPDNRGFGAGVNQGVAHADAERLLVLNPDCEVQEGAVAALLRRLDAEPRLGVTGPLLLDGDGNPRHDAFKAWPSLWSLFVALCLPVGHALMGTPLHPEVLTQRQIRDRHEVARVCGSALCFRREAWEAAGPMDEGYFMYFEEVEWQRRVVARAWTVAMTPEARAIHLVQSGEGLETVPPSYLRSAFRYHLGRGRPVWAVAATVRTAIALSRATLLASGLVPRLREKSARMRAGFEALDGLARDEVAARARCCRGGGRGDRGATAAGPSRSDRR